MSLKQRIDQDLKTALLSGNKDLATTLRGLKSVIQYEEVAKGEREKGLADEAIMTLLNKEVKKRQESTDLYMQGGDAERANKELQEKTVIAGYLPKQLSDEELEAIVSKVVEAQEDVSPQLMGKIIGLVKQEAGPMADGGRIAHMVQERLKT